MAEELKLCCELNGKRHSKLCKGPRYCIEHQPWSWSGWSDCPEEACKLRSIRSRKSYKYLKLMSKKIRSGLSQKDILTEMYAWYRGNSYSGHADDNVLKQVLKEDEICSDKRYTQSTGQGDELA